ncbi:hypothetical protein [Alicyclobacillus macrosporangiidus]|uniref:hypothetical protein n=1 Tax=Alicyclobacillus macrosporangiidus TaxID=392015 RepID=UPI0004969C44|nr:hypothetical protein [Alicyclobacillus macrosporangiidus]
MTWILVGIIIILLILLLARRGSGWSGRPVSRPYNTGPGYMPPSYGPMDPPPSTGFSTGSFLGGMAAGALLTYLLEQGRIDWAQYNYFNSLDQQQMIDELMQQNILQQDEIDQLQQELANRGWDGPDGSYGGDAGYGGDPDPGNHPYDQVDFNPGSYDSANYGGDPGYDPGSYDAGYNDAGYGDSGFGDSGGFDNGGDGGWV